MTYQHLSQAERYQIQALHIAGQSNRQIAAYLHRHPSSIGRELKRGVASPTRTYKANPAHKLAQQRQLASRNAASFAAQDWAKVEPCLRQGLSPQQASGRLKLEGSLCISHESIYRYIYRDKAKSGDLHSLLRCQKKRKKRYGSGQDRRGQIKGRLCIEHRPAEVDSRSAIGDWEGDTVIGRGNTGVLVTLVERKSRYTLAAKLSNRQAEPVSQAIIELLRPHKSQCTSITFDNGKEFSEHAFIAFCLKATVYFAHPYHSWERGTNENTNGLLRQYFPKTMSFANLTPEEVGDAVRCLNHRPRKCLGYRTPHEVFYDLPVTPLF